MGAAMPHPPFRRVLITPDKFKGTLTAGAAARALRDGLRRAWPGAKTTLLPLTDGGEGFAEVMVRQTGGRWRTARTTDAIGRPCRVRWGLLHGGRTAVIGLADASGLARLPLDRRDPEATTNLGTGRLIARALAAGCREIIVGLGGSATTEGGISLAAAVGYRFLDARGAEIALTGGGLARLARIVPPARKPRARFVVATDVDNPLFGRRGAAHRFGPQKGADAATVRRLDANLRRLARIVRRDLGPDLAGEPGAGAAGGCGYGLMVFFGARRENGFDLVRRVTGLDALVRAHDLVVTGEGCFDHTSLHGKAPQQLGELARRLGKPAWAFCGRAELTVAQSPFARLEALSTPQRPGPPPEAFTSAQHARRLAGLAFAAARR